MSIVINNEKQKGGPSPNEKRLASHHSLARACPGAIDMSLGINPFCSHSLCN